MPLKSFEPAIFVTLTVAVGVALFFGIWSFLKLRSFEFIDLHEFQGLDPVIRSTYYKLMSILAPKVMGLSSVMWKKNVSQKQIDDMISRANDTAAQIQQIIDDPDKQTIGNIARLYAASMPI